MAIQAQLFDAIPRQERTGWVPDAPPDLSGEREVILDFETNGLSWWRKSRPVGVGIGTRDGHTWYLPVAHSGGNLDEEAIRRWMSSDQGLKGKHVTGFGTKFEVHMSRVFGVDLEELGCTVSDVAHWAALLDDHRMTTSLESVSQDYLGEGKIQGLDKNRMAYYHAADVANYCKQDVRLTNQLITKLSPLLDKEDLQRVRQLEDDVIFPTCEMERNGAPIDEEKLDLWLKRSEQDYVKCLWELYHLTGMKLNPGSPLDARALFAKYDLPLPRSTAPGKDFGKVTFVDRYLREYKHPAVRLFRRTKKLGSLRSKFLIPYREELTRNGVLRYSLNQLRGEDGGTISGRFSSSSFGGGLPDGINAQQVAGKKQLASFGEELESEMTNYIIRELFVPTEGLWLSADASQIEYRLMAHYARPPRIIQAYKDDPNTDYHNTVRSMLQEICEISRERTKDCNFALIYGAGLKKIAWMLGMTEIQVRPFISAYDRMVPEARQLMKFVMDLAERRGYVRTILGRRARFREQDAMFLHSALNRIIQGTAADINKRKIVELHAERKFTGLKLRFTVHDEADGDVPDVEAGERVRQVLDRQSFSTRVPILWKVKTGHNWAQASGMAA